jgi:hypothetical protein
MPAGYQFKPQPDDVARAVLGKSTWAVLALTLDIELFTQMHYRQSIEPDENLSPLFKDVFLYHWKEESQHAILDELEWIRCDRKVSAQDRDKGVTEFIELVAAVDGILQMQASDDSNYFAETCGRHLSAEERTRLETGLLKAYRWQYIFSGAQHPHFVKVLTTCLTYVVRAHRARLQALDAIFDRLKFEVKHTRGAFPSFAKAELSKLVLACRLKPRMDRSFSSGTSWRVSFLGFASWDRRGNEPRNEASGVVLQKRERSEPPCVSAQRSLLKNKDALSRDFKGCSLRSRSLVPPRSPRASARRPSYPRRGT